MKKWLLVWLLFSCVAHSQRIEPGAILTVAAESFVGFDKFGAAYFITDNTLSKLQDGKSLQYQNVALSRISRVDLVNPLKIVLHYSDFNTVVMVDNQLNEITRIRFSDLPQPIVVTATGNASQNRLWIYDSLTQQLGLFDYLANNISFLTQPLTGNIQYYETDFNTFQWIDDTGSRYSCDVFGKITTLGKVPDFDSIRFVSNTIVLYRNSGKLFQFSSITGESSAIDLPENSFESFHFNDQILSIFTKQGITNYKITTP